MITLGFVSSEADSLFRESATVVSTSHPPKNKNKQQTNKNQKQQQQQQNNKQKTFDLHRFPPSSRRSIKSYILTYSTRNRGNLSQLRVFVVVVCLFACLFFSPKGQNLILRICSTPTDAVGSWAAGGDGWGWRRGPGGEGGGERHFLPNDSTSFCKAFLPPTIAGLHLHFLHSGLRTRIEVRLKCTG